MRKDWEELDTKGKLNALRKDAEALAETSDRRFAIFSQLVDLVAEIDTRLKQVEAAVKTPQ